MLKRLTFTFTAPSLIEPELLTFAVTVTDNDGATATQVLEVQVNAYASINTLTIEDSGMQECVQSMPQADVGMEKLACDGIQIADLSDLASFARLTDLTVNNAGLTDVTGLANLADAKKIRCSQQST